MSHESQPQHDTEARILKSAETEFISKGYEGAKTTSIAEAAGVTHAMLHYYFRTKSNLFERIITDKLGNLGDILYGNFQNNEMPLKERLVYGIEQHFDFLMKNRALPRFIFNSAYTHPEILEAIRLRMLEIFNKVVATLQESIDDNARAGACRQVDARMLMLDIISLNIFPFLASPIIENVFISDSENIEKFIAQRKAENVRTILDKLNLK